MPHYQYRWIYAAMMVVVILLVSYCYDLSPIISELKQQHSFRKSQEEQLIIYKRFSVNKKANHSKQKIMHKLPADEISMLIELSQLLHKHDLVLQALTTFSKPASNAIMLRWTIAGEFERIADFIFALSRQLPGTIILDFSYKANEKMQTFTADTLIYKNKRSVVSEINDVIKVSHNPFCHANQFEQNNELQKLQAVTLQQINMIAFLKQGARREAWISLPNKSAVNIHMGSMFGKEHARVIDIQPDRIVLLLPDNTRYVMSK